MTSDNLASLNLEELVIRKFAQFQIPTAIGGKNEGVWSSTISRSLGSAGQNRGVKMRLTPCGSTSQIMRIIFLSAAELPKSRAALALAYLMAKAAPA